MNEVVHTNTHLCTEVEFFWSVLPYRSWNSVVGMEYQFSKQIRN